MFNCIFCSINFVVFSLLSGLFKLFKIRCVLSGINSIACCSLLASSIEHPLQKGLLLVHTGRESIKIGPPLVISKEALLEGIKVIEEAIDIALKDFQG